MKTFFIIIFFLHKNLNLMLNPQVENHDDSTLGLIKVWWLPNLVRSLPFSKDHVSAISLYRNNCPKDILSIISHSQQIAGGKPRGWNVKVIHPSAACSRACVVTTQVRQPSGKPQVTPDQVYSSRFRFFLLYSPVLEISKGCEASRWR